MNPKDDEPLEAKSLLIFFPEGFVAVFAVIAAPFWAFYLAAQHHLVIGIGFWIGAWSFGYLAYWSYRKGDRGGIYLAIFGIIGLVLAISKWLH